MPGLHSQREVTLLGRPMLFASDAITAALMFQWPKWLLASRALPSVWDKNLKKIHDQVFSDFVHFWVTLITVPKYFVLLDKHALLKIHSSLCEEHESEIIINWGFKNAMFFPKMVDYFIFVTFWSPYSIINNLLKWLKTSVIQLQHTYFFGFQETSLKVCNKKYK
jgi:hypothetical protein